MVEIKKNKDAGKQVAEHKGFLIFVIDAETPRGMPYYRVVSKETGEDAGTCYMNISIAKRCATRLSNESKKQFDYRLNQ